MPPPYYAHSAASLDQAEWHRLSVHLTDTVARAAATLESIGGAEIGRAAGLLHDIAYVDGLHTVAPGERAPRVHPVRLDDDVGVDQYGTVVACHVALQIDRLLDAVHSEQLRQILDGSVEQHGHAPDGDMAAVQCQAHHLHELLGEPR